MSKITLANLANLQNEATAVSTINANMAIIQTAWDDNLSRDGLSPNQWTDTQDANSNRLVNLPAPISGTEPARLEDIQVVINDIASINADVIAAASSASSSAASAVAAANSASAASGSATAAAASAASAAVTAVVGDTFNFASSTTMADPGTGTFRFNNATPASSTAIALSASSSATGNPNIGAFIATWAQSSSTVKGTLIFRKLGSPTTFCELQITAVANNSTWYQITVSGGTGSGSWTNGDATSIQFSRTGDQGSAGAGSGNFSTSTSAVDSQILIASGTSGTAGKFATTTGLLKASSGVIAAATLNTDYFSSASTIPIANGGTAQTTAKLARTSSGLNIDQVTVHGDSNYTVLSTDRAVIAENTFTAPRTWTLPQVTSVNSGQRLAIRDINSINGSNTLTIATFAGDGLYPGGGSSIILSNPGAGVDLIPDGGAGWSILIPGVAQGGTGATTASAARTNLVVPTTVQADFLSGLIKAPVNGRTIITIYVPFTMTLTSLATYNDSGTCTATLNIQSAPVTGGAIATINSVQTSALTAANVASAGNFIDITFSSVSSSVNFAFTLAYTRVLA